jgi:eukaryotic-like serine/threonine-protein kinase
MVAGKYALLRRLGQGGMAEVFLAKHEADGGFQKLVVIKRTLGHLTGQEFTSMFLEEARLASDLRHPNIVTILDIGKSDGSYFIVMEFLHGQDVRKLQRKVATFSQMVPLGACAQIVIDAATGLHHAHSKADLQGVAQHIVHRDVSPQNIIVTYDGATKIVDFGIAKAANQANQTQAGVLKGKYTYMSPEQAMGDTLDGRSDQFALGIVFWELLTMRRLFKRESETATLEAIVAGGVPPPSRFRQDIPAALDDLVLTALASDRRKRFRDCQELALAIEDIMRQANVAHSPTRLAQFMRKLFATTLVEEAALGVVNPDGSLTSKVLPPAVPPPLVAAVDEAKAPEQDPPSSMVEVTAADRKPNKTLERPVKAERADVRRPRSVSSQQPIEVVVPTAIAPPAKERSAQRPTPPKRTPDPAPSSSRRQALLAGGIVVGGVVLVGAVALWDKTRRVNLVVRSEPRGARIFLDGVDTQQITPAPFSGVVADEPHRIHLELAGHVPLDEVVVPPSGQRVVEVNLMLQAK